jgi:hypothetical protein
MELLIYIFAPFLAIFMDFMYFESVKSIIFGFFPVKNKYIYKQFFSMRIFGIIFSSLIISYSVKNKELIFSMIGCLIFLFFHFAIYYRIWKLEK